MIGNLEIKQEERPRLRNYLVVFRWISLALGLWMTRLNNPAYLINNLPDFLKDLPMILGLLLFLYHFFATFVTLKFDDNNFNVAMLIFMDAIAGAFISYYYGLSYFFIAVMLPTLTATFYFDILVSMIVILFCSLFNVFVIAIPLFKRLQSVGNRELVLGHTYDLLGAFAFSSLAILISFIWAMRQEEDHKSIKKKFQDEKNILYESYQATRKEFNALLSELENKQEQIERLQSSIEQNSEEKDEVQKTLENTLRNVENLRKAYGEAEERAHSYLEQLKEIEEKHIIELEMEFERHMAEKDEIIKARDALIRELEEQIQERAGENSAKVEEMQEKIELLIDKIKQLNSVLQFRESLFDSFAAINESHDLEKTFSNVISEALKLLPSQTAVLFIKEFTENGPMLFAHVAASPYKTLFIDYGVVPGDGPVGWVAANKKPLRINNGEIKLEDGTEISSLLTNEKSLLAAPLIYKDDLIGVLYLGKPQADAYDERELHLLSTFCRLAGPVIHTAQEFQKSVHAGLVDVSTGLYNEIFFYERFNEESARSLRYGIPLTCILINIENYREFAQKAEKTVQDKLIEDLSEILQTNIRETDLAARLEENKFAIIITHTEKKDVLQVAERIRMSAQLRSFGTPAAKQANLYLAIALANMPDDAGDGDSLYQTALGLLEKARKAGGKEIAYINPEKL